MLVEKNTSLQNLNTFGIAASADVLVRLTSTQAVQEVASSAILRTPQGALRPSLVLGGGSNIVLSGDVVHAVVLKMEIPGMALVEETAKHWIVQAGAGVRWHDLVEWTLQQGWGGLENLALIPGTVGAAPVQFGHAGLVDIKADDRAVFAKFNGQGQADIAQANQGNGCVVQVHDFVSEI